ncbi:MAG: hypothetical protein RIM84_20990 [Alphaproteobacteria bacterium]
MTLKQADRCKETTTTTGTGTYNLAGASTGFRSFVAGVGDGNSCRYFVSDGVDFEGGRGTVTDASPDTLSRDTILVSSNGGAAVNWGAGTRDIWCDNPAEEAGWVLLDKQEASNSATIDFEGLLDSTYLAFKVVMIDVVPATDNVILQMLTSTDNGSNYDSSAGDYDYTTIRLTAGDALTESDSNSAGVMVLANIVGSDTGEGLNGELTLSNPLGTALYKRARWFCDVIDSGGDAMFQLGAGARMATADVDAIRFLFSSGNIESGTFLLFGLRA